MRYPPTIRWLSVAIAIWIAPAATAAERDPFGTDQLRPAAPSQAWQQTDSPTCARPVTIPDPLTLLDAIELALCNNPRTRESWAAAKGSAAQVGIARGAYLPSINATGTLQSTDQRNTVLSGRRDQATGSLALNYLLFDFGGRDAALEQARQSLFAADWTHNATLQAVLQDAATAYFQLSANEDAVIAARTAEQSAQKSLDAARAKQKAGAATRADVLQSQTAFSQAQLTRVQADGNAASARGVLANRIGLSSDRPVHIVPPADLEARRMADADVTLLVQAATARRPELLSADATVRAAESNIKVQEAAGKPTISAFGTGAGTNNRPGADSRSGTIGVSISIPLFTGFQSTYRIRAARELLEQQQATRDRLLNDITLDVWQAYQQLRTQSQALVTAGDLVASARESYDVALGRYKAGVGTVTDLLTAQTALANAEFQRIQARFNWNVAKITLAKAIGGLDTGLFAASTAPSTGTTR
ncbi:MAG: TolC family protein [Betaproteobacteria bacterium]